MTSIFLGVKYYQYQQTTQNTLSGKLHLAQKELTALKNVDQYKRNNELEDTIKHIETTYQKAVKSYEALLDLKTLTDKTDDLDSLFADSLSELSKRNYATAEAKLDDLNGKIQDQIK